MTDLNTSIKKLYGVGEKRSAAYAKMGVYTVGDLLCHYPRGYKSAETLRNLWSGYKHLRAAAAHFQFLL